MKRKTILSLCCLALCFGFIFSGCKKNEIPNKDVINTKIERDLPTDVLSYLKSQYLDTTGIQDKGKYYVVEGDILVSKENIQNNLSTTQNRSVSGKPGETIAQAHTNNLVLNENTNIIIGMNTYQPRWFYAIRDAVAAWNTIGNCRINLVHSYNNSTAGAFDITIVEDNSLGIGGFGQAEWPSNGKPGAIIKVNSLTNNVYQSGPMRGQDNGIRRTSGQDLYMLIHEIGHCLGIRHTDWAHEGYYGIINGSMAWIGANPIPGTPSNGSAYDDPNSVMNSANLGTDKTWTPNYAMKFSNYDIIAAQYLYPVQAGTVFTNIINGDNQKQVNGTIISTAGAMYQQNLSYEWRLLDQNLNVLWNWPNEAPQIEWSHNVAGTYYLECRINGLEAPMNWARQTITFY